LTLILFAFLFETPLLAILAASGAVSIPVVIHLLRRFRRQVVDLPTIRFLLQAKKVQEKRWRLEQWFLLLLRCLMVLLLVAACTAAMPWVEPYWRNIFPNMQGQKALGTIRSHTILVFDSSLSMLATKDGKSAFDKAKSNAEKFSQACELGDSISLIQMSFPPKTIINEPSEDLDKVRDEILALVPTHGCSDLAGTLALVEALLQRSPSRFKERRVIFFTDLQRGSWLGTNNAAANVLFAKLRIKADVSIFDVGSDIETNLAISNLEVEGQVAGVGSETRFSAKLQVFGDKPKSPVKVKLLVGKIGPQADSVSIRQMAEDSFDMQASSQSTISLTHKFTEPGDYAIAVQLNQDRLAADDSSRMVVRVSKELNVLIVNGKYAARELEKSTGFLQIALDNDGVDSIPVKFKMKSIDEPRISDELNRGLVGYDSIFFADIARWRNSEALAVEEFVRKGGGVVFWLGDQAEPQSYNDNLFRDGKGLLPAKLLKQVNAAPDSLFQFQPDFASFQSPPLSAFRTPEDKLSLLAPRFTKIFQVEPLSKSSVRQLASFKQIATGNKADEPKEESIKAPALLGWQPLAVSQSKKVGPSNARSKGWVYLVSSSANTEWNNWPAYPSYLPMVQELLIASCAGKLKERSQLCGSTLEDYPNQQSGEVKVSHPDGSSETFALGQDLGFTKLNYTNTMVSGFYFAKYLSTQTSLAFAINPMLSPLGESGFESDLSRCSVEEINQLYPDANISLLKDVTVRGAKGNDTNSEENTDKGLLREKIAGAILFLFLLVAILEFVISFLMGLGRSLVLSQQKPWWAIVSSWLVVLASVSLLVLFLSASSSADALRFLPERMAKSFDSFRGQMEVGEGETLQTKLINQNEFLPSLTTRSVRNSLFLILSTCTVLAFIRLVFNRSLLGAITLTGLRLSFWWILLWILLPQIGLGFERFSWPDVAILVDDSQSMSVSDKYQDEAREKFARKIADASSQQVTRLKIAQSILTENQGKFLADILERKFRIHLYRVSTRAEKIALITKPSEIPDAISLLNSLKSDPTHDASKLGNASRQVLNDFRGTGLGGVVLFSDGIVTDGEDLAKMAKFASQSATPFFTVGIGEELEPKDIAVLEVQAPDDISFGDRVVFDVKVGSSGFKNSRTSVLLKEKGKPDILDRQEIVLDESGLPISVRLGDRPKLEGIKQYEIEVPIQKDETQTANNRIEKNVLVQKANTVKVLFVEGCRRYEYHYLKTLLERQTETPGGKKLFSLNVLLLEAESDFPSQDRTAIADFPSRTELFQYDVVIFGDIDPKSGEPAKFKRFLADLNEFVKEKGGGLLFIAGQRFFPSEYVSSQLTDLLPVEINSNRLIESPEGISQGYHLIPSPSSANHPIFRFHPEEKENAELWRRLKELYWCFVGVVPKKGAEVLGIAEGNSAAISGKNFPLMVQQYYGAGRVLFFSFDESWRWAYREDQAYYNYFWLQTLRFLSRSSSAKITLKLDKNNNYRRGDSIRVTVRLPIDGSVPDSNLVVKVAMERKNLNDAKGKEVFTLDLAKVSGSRGAYEAIIDNAKEGKYLFQLQQPSKQDPVPFAECFVFPPPGEMEKLTMAQNDLSRLALLTKGKFYLPDQASSVPNDLPKGFQLSSGTPSPPWDLWNHPLVFILIILLLSLNWFLGRKLQLL